MIKRITIKDVAARAGVTHTTVSRVIHNDNRISEETRSRVRKAIEVLDYQPNLVARGLVRNRTQAVALITPELDPFALPVVRSVAESASRRDYALMLYSTSTWLKEKPSFEWVMQNWLVDGILIYNLVYHERIPDDILELRARNLPFVFVNKFLDKTDLNAAGIDNYAASSMVIEHLASLGRKRIAVMNGNTTSVDGMERSIGCRLALERLGLPYDESIVGCGMWRDEDAYREMSRILENPHRPTALMCANDLMAIGAIKAIRDRGLKVPQDIAVASIDDLEAGRYVDIPLTTVHLPMFEAGAKAFDLLMEILQNPKQAPKQIRLRPELIVRRSSVS